MLPAKPRQTLVVLLLVSTLLAMSGCTALPPLIVVVETPATANTGAPLETPQASEPAAAESAVAPSQPAEAAAAVATGQVSGPGAPTPVSPAEVVPVRLPEVTLSGSDSIGDPKAPELGNTGYDVQKYTLDLSLDPYAGSLDAAAQINARSTLDGLNRLSLDFIGYGIDWLTVDGQPASFERQDAKLWIDLPQPLFINQPFTVTVAYSGRPEPLASRYVPFVGLGLTMDPAAGRAFAVNEPDGARSWFPANDHPLDKALFEFQIEVPSPLVAVANGQLLAEERNDATTRYVYASDDPMAPYLATVAVADYLVLQDVAPNGVPLRHYVLPESREQAAEAFAVTGEAMAFLEGLFGPYPFDSYGHAVIEAGGLALETQTMTVWGEDMLYGAPENVSTVVVHELAHQWIGDSVSLASWSDTWLNEGFATYAMLLWLERSHPEEAFSALAQYEANADVTGGTALGDPAPDQLFGSDPYIKGAWVLHMLRQELGDQDFFSTLTRYASQFAGDNVTSEDFQAVAEAVSGRDLASFFRQWVYQPGVPELHVGWTTTEMLDGQTTFLMRVCQTQPDAASPPYEVALDVTILGAGAEVNERLPIVRAEEGFAVPVTFQPTELLVDPDNNLLAITAVDRIDALTLCPTQ